MTATHLFPLNETVILTGIWWTSLALAALSATTMLLLVVRRLFQERRKRKFDERRKALTQLVMIFLDAPADDEAVRAMCHGADLKLVLEVGSGLSKGRRRRSRIARTDLYVLVDIAQDLLGSVRGASREQVIDLLRQTGAEAALLKDLKSWRIGRRVKAIETLALLPGAEVIAALGEALADRNPDVRLAAASALVNMGHDVTVAQLVEKLEVGVVIRSRMLRDIFRVVATRDTGDLIELLDSEPPNLVAALAIYAIGTTQDYSLIPVITRHASRPAVDVRAEAMRALAAIGHPAAGPTVMAGLRDPAWEVRTEAAICAGRIPLPNAVPLLQERLSDEQWWPRFRAAEALREIGGRGRYTLEQARKGQGAAARIADMVLAEEESAAA